MEKEIFNGKYIIYSDGKVWSNKRNRFLKCKKIKGYPSFVHHNKTYKIHRLIAELFIPNPNNFQQVNHINGIKGDNRVENLEWINNRDNCIHYHFKENKFTGASFDKSRNKYVTYIRHNSKTIFLGRYNTPEEGHKVYMEYRLKHNLL